MSKNRPFVLSIAGFDPSGGAGVLADVKTFEQHQVYGLAIVTGNTIQTENEFIKMAWISMDSIIESIEVLCNKYEIKAVKIGIIPSLDYLENIVSTIKRIAPKTKIIWDSVLKSSTNFDFMNLENQTKLEVILKQIYLITPNYNEIVTLSHSNETPENIAKSLSKSCAVLLKGGHNLEALGTDFLFLKDEIITLLPETKIILSKHGSGCVLSSAITANLALGFDTTSSCQKAKIYIEKFLHSNNTLLGYHHD
ncbi:hydroxymethylpyrimidine/phosphomethylpyrimidine kinase [Flavobacterium jejuense]|uniref:hydroxymethylpyrimidine kinase n=1 Tax=Flavobacterium jejuense TaxID=1544455 RepID=A0ABX0IVR3_9FLAO|nr:hydroxymethylpyrimidine/phosphomethylpyrimidine kinase [Flavobacterium jejuense]NHN27967.1 hydroxymethylpyrimidine/phosphomethylpyrimidine kinase [Flavobacterium jejuense]